MTDCWCGGSPWKHKWRRPKSELCDQARENFNRYMREYTERNREKENARRRAYRAGVSIDQAPPPARVSVLVPEHDPL